jgi:hypothetical protein
MSSIINPTALAALRRLVEDGEYPQEIEIWRELINSGAVEYIGGTELRPTDLAHEMLNVEHIVSVATVRGRYPYRPACSCGQEFRGYAAQHAAQDVADAHAQVMQG